MVAGRWKRGVKGRMADISVLASDWHSCGCWKHSRGTKRLVLHSEVMKVAGTRGADPWEACIVGPARGEACDNTAGGGGGRLTLGGREPAGVTRQPALTAAHSRPPPAPPSRPRRERRSLGARTDRLTAAAQRGRSALRSPSPSPAEGDRRGGRARDARAPPPAAVSPAPGAAAASAQRGLAAQLQPWSRSASVGCCPSRATSCAATWATRRPPFPCRWVSAARCGRLRGGLILPKAVGKVRGRSSSSQRGEGEEPAGAAGGRLREHRRGVQGGRVGSRAETCAGWGVSPAVVELGKASPLRGVEGPLRECVRLAWV